MTDKNYKTELWKAVVADDGPTVSRLLKESGDPNSWSPNYVPLIGSSTTKLNPLLVAVYTNAHSVLPALLEAGADPNEVRVMDASFGISLWLDDSKQGLAPDGLYAWTALGFAVVFTQNPADPQGNAISLAEGNKTTDPELLLKKLRTCEVLVQYGADPWLKNKAGLSAMDEASRGGYSAIMELFHSARPDRIS